MNPYFLRIQQVLIHSLCLLCIFETILLFKKEIDEKSILKKEQMTKWMNGFTLYFTEYFVI